MNKTSIFTPANLIRDLTASLVVFVVALPLCLGLAQASGVPLLSGILSGIIGGVLVGMISGSHTSVSGPGNTLMAILAASLVTLGSFEALLLAVFVAGFIQLGLGTIRAGALSAFVPSSVIKGLLAAIGIILILKQIPHVLGHDADPEGEMAFIQPDKENTFSEFLRLFGGIHRGAALVGLVCVVLLFAWDRIKFLKKSPIPAPLVVVVLGIGLSLLLRQLGGRLVIGNSHLVQVPVAESVLGIFSFLKSPAWSQWTNPAVWSTALTIAVVASLETLLNLEAVDKIDPQQRRSPANRELMAQGIGNITCGLLGAIPVTSVIVRSSVNLDAGSRTKASTIFHGILLAACVVFLPRYLNMIPLSCLAAILLVTGVKLASPALVRQIWSQGWPQFIPFAVTVVAIVTTDLLRGILIGLATSIAFILHSNMRRPIRRFVEKHLGGDVVHVELANQVSFLNRAALSSVLNEMTRGRHVLLDARNTDYIDPDVLALIREFKETTGPARGVEVSLLGFRRKYQLNDEMQYVDHSTRELQNSLTPEQVLQILKDGHERFRSGRRLTRNLTRQVYATSEGQHPLAVVLSCVDSRAATELIFDLGVGDILSIRIAGNVTSRKVLASVEYGCTLAGARLVLVMGHTQCGAVRAAVDIICSNRPAIEVTGCQHLDHIVRDVEPSTDPLTRVGFSEMSDFEMDTFIDAVARRNVARTVNVLRQESETINQLVAEGRIAIVGAMYNVATGEIEFLPETVWEPMSNSEAG